MRQKISNNKGVSIIELLIAAMILGAFIVAVGTAYASIARSELSANKHGRAINMARESLEAVYTIATNDWSQIEGLTEGADYHVTTNGGQWTIQSGSHTNGEFTHVLRFQNIRRDSNGNMASSGTPDPKTKRVTARITRSNFGALSHFELTTIISDWRL